MPAGAPREYNEMTMARAIARQKTPDCLVVVDNCMWPGSECDLLCVTKSLRVIDIEIKVSRADLKADRGKDKWHTYLSWEQQRVLKGQLERQPTRAECQVPCEWPRNVWKHYYAVAAPIWQDALLAHCGPSSGVFTVELGERGFARLDVKRRAKPNRDSKVLSPADVIAIARLASLRMWDAYTNVERLTEENARLHEIITPVSFASEDAGEDTR